MDFLGIALIILAFILIIAGIIGSVMPALPGPPIAWGGLLVSYFSPLSHIHPLVLVLSALVMIFVTVADNIFPSVMTKKRGGTKAGSIGATVGLIVGFFLGSIPGVLLGPFLGALIFELFASPSDFRRAFTSAKGAFLGFLLGTGMKLMTVLIFLWILIIALVPFRGKTEQSKIENAEKTELITE